MKEQLEAFALQITEIGSKKPAELIPYFVYFLTVVVQEEEATAAGVARCFEWLRLPGYSNISSFLSRKSARDAAQLFLKRKNGYQLTRTVQLEIQKTLHTGPAKLETSLLLRGLLPKVVETNDRAFLLEAIDCYEIGARRAAILMTWLLTISHMQARVLSHKLTEFNAALALDKGVKLNAVSKMDDFSEVKESKFIELLRASGVISNDIRKILDVKLGIRNSVAHPSAISVSEVKATEFIMDLIENIVQKF